MRYVDWQQVKDVVNDYRALWRDDNPGLVMTAVDEELRAFGLRIVFCGSLDADRHGWFKIEKSKGDYEQAEGLILGIIAGPQGVVHGSMGLHPTVVIEQAISLGQSEQTVREALWRLIGDRRVILTSDRRLELAAGVTEGS